MPGSSDRWVGGRRSGTQAWEPRAALPRPIYPGSANSKSANPESANPKSANRESAHGQRRHSGRADPRCRRWRRGRPGSGPPGAGRGRCGTPSRAALPADGGRCLAGRCLEESCRGGRFEPGPGGCAAWPPGAGRIYSRRLASGTHRGQPPRSPPVAVRIRRRRPSTPTDTPSPPLPAIDIPGLDYLVHSVRGLERTPSSTPVCRADAKSATARDVSPLVSGRTGSTSTGSDVSSSPAPAIRCRFLPISARAPGFRPGKPLPARAPTASPSSPARWSAAAPRPAVPGLRPRPRRPLDRIRPFLSEPCALNSPTP